MTKPATFGLLVRVPSWVQAPPTTAGFKLAVNDQPDGSIGFLGYAMVRPRQWKDGDRVSLSYELSARLVPGHFSNADHAALAWGPFLLAYDEARNQQRPAASTVVLGRESAKLILESGSGLVFRGTVVGRKDTSPVEAVFVPFADAGSTGGIYRIWLPFRRDPT
jgi:DUF1680 family protein